MTAFKTLLIVITVAVSQQLVCLLYDHNSAYWLYLLMHQHFPGLAQCPCSFDFDRAGNAQQFMTPARCWDKRM